MSSPSRYLISGVLLLLLITKGFSQEPAETAVSEIQDLIPLIRVSSSDISNPSRWKNPHTIIKVEELFQNPLTIPVQTSIWSQKLLESQSELEMFHLAQNLISVSTPSPRNFIPQEISLPEPISTSPISQTISRLIQAVGEAKQLLISSYSEMSQKEKENVLRFYDFPTPESETGRLKSSRFKRQVFESLKKQKQDALLQAGEKLMRAVEKEKPLIQSWVDETAKNPEKDFKTLRWKSPMGEVLISGAGENYYDAKELKDVVLLIDAGGKNRYADAAAGSREGEVKVVLDWGEDVTIVSSQTAASAGSGIFGIGLLYLPNPSGTKTIETGSYSQGMGLCGIGALFLNGKGILRSDRFSQGVGIFGVGILSHNAGNGSLYETNLYGQGVGLTRGVGLFRFQGSDSQFLAGLLEPDPRESLGSTSLCQGVGYGPRGYAGGGIGVCALKGDRLHLESSYFAQGAGYWHSAGVFHLCGNSNTLKARRYDQGSGIHSAVGSFRLDGDKNHCINWGVGPAFGWDGGIGWSLLFGNGNTFQTDWGAGTASMNRSRSFSYFSGSNNRLDLSGLGSAQLSYDQPDYAVSIFKGKDNLFRLPSIKKPRDVSGSLYGTPWGTLSLQGVQLRAEVGTKKIEWKPLQQKGSGHSPTPTQNLAQELNGIEKLPADEMVETLIEIASAFSMDKVTPRKALAFLLALQDSHRWRLIHSLYAPDVDQFIQVRTAIAIWGTPILNELKDAIAKEPDLQRRMYLVSLLGLFPATETVPFLMEMLQEKDWRV
ncbi:MAG: HEAT repeat domain-containing protein, partial [Elusimicrobia bacterium]|nr:HEAT repeat domain-containing protein [Elusimicrobiota bacterium]